MAFSNLKDQQRAAQVLQRSLARGRLAHAYLFVGAPMPILETAALELAKTLNCESPSEDGPRIDCCDRCGSCRRIQDHNHPDIQHVRPESKSRVITIHQTRELMRILYLKPTEARYKVCVLVSAERMNVQAANAFLKTLEEPPNRSVLVLLSTHPDQALETIRSRCLRLAFSSGGMEAFTGAQIQWVEEFNEIAAQEPPGLLGRYRMLDRMLGRLSEMRTSVKDRLAASSPLEKHEDADAKVRQRWESELAASIESEYRRQRSELLTCVQWWLRDVWLLTIDADPGLLCFPKLAEPLRRVAQRMNPDEAARNLDCVETTQYLLGTNVQEALALEVGLLKLKL